MQIQMHVVSKTILRVEITLKTVQHLVSNRVHVGTQVGKNIALVTDPKRTGL
jgi:hypothetical protein